MFIVCPAFVIVVNLLVLHYRKQFEYLCPNCHKIFDPSFKEFALASHTPRTRKLTCPHCHMKAYCLELARNRSVLLWSKKAYSVETKLACIEMKKVDKSNKVIMDALGVKNASQVKTWWRWYQNDELYRFHQPVGN